MPEELAALRLKHSFWNIDSVLITFDVYTIKLITVVFHNLMIWMGQRQPHFLKHKSMGMGLSLILFKSKTILKRKSCRNYKRGCLGSLKYSLKNNYMENAIFQVTFLYIVKIHNIYKKNREARANMIVQWGV